MFQISLKAARVNADLTQDAAADALKVDKTAIISWEKGRTAPRVDQLIKLCDVYRVPIDNIFLNVKST